MLWIYNLKSKYIYSLHCHCQQKHFKTKILALVNTARKYIYASALHYNNASINTYGCFVMPGAPGKNHNTLLCENFYYKRYLKTKSVKSDHSSDDGKGNLLSSDVKGKLLSGEKFKLIMKMRKNTYVLDQEVAEKLVTCVMRNRANPKAPILELDCGPGLISQEFLKQGASKVIVLETKDIFFSFIKDIEKSVGGEKFHHFRWPILNFFFKFNGVKSSEGSAEYLKYEHAIAELLQTSSTENSNDVPYSIFCLGGKEDNTNFIFYIIRNMPTEDTILSKGFVEFFLLVHPKLQKKLTLLSTIPGRDDEDFTGNLKERKLVSHFSSNDVFLHLLYDVSFIGEFDASSFVPPFSSVKKSQGDIDASKRALIKLQLKRNATELLPLEQHVQFLIFLRQIYRKKKTCTISAMEMLIPGCGLRMLNEGFTMMDIVLISKPEYFLQLFKVMQKWPEYENSPLRQHISMKSTGGIDQKDLEEEE